MASQSPPPATPLVNVNADPPLINRKGDTLYYTGSLNRTAVNSIVAQYTSASQLRRLVINSPGGEVNTGMMLGNWVHKLQLDVEVTLLCFSSCANYIFPAGKTKIIGPTALIGWHGSTFQQSTMTLEALREEIRPSMVQNFPHVPPELKKELDFESFLTQQATSFFTEMEQARKSESELYQRLQVNPNLPNLLEYCRLSAGNYTLTLAGMKKLGLAQISGPADYPRSALAYHNQRRSEKTPPLPPLDISIMEGLNCQMQTKTHIL